jgi:hypothetical protein
MSTVELVSPRILLTSIERPGFSIHPANKFLFEKMVSQGESIAFFVHQFN